MVRILAYAFDGNRGDEPRYSCGRWSGMQMVELAVHVRSDYLTDELRGIINDVPRGLERTHRALTTEEKTAFLTLLGIGTER